MRFHVFVDFDGTIAPLDTTDLLLERFADPRWLDIEEQWKTGLIGSRECMVRQVDLVRATPADIDRFVDEIEIDPGFRGFVRLLSGLGHAVTVVSDGLDRTVGTVLKRAGIDVPFRANRLAWVGGNRWRLTFPHARSDCRALAGNCKCQFADAERVNARIVVGDGRSDYCLAGRADLVLAKGSLVSHCAELDLPHVVFRDFSEASELLMHWIAARVGSPTERPAQMGDE
ncbi:MAG: HAD-IB family phosphatase [Hyphomicrobiaceae bacterium]|nr:HAD-IB family phosphatase [Hyphomicrobiaceae bacterium]